MGDEPDDADGAEPDPLEAVGDGDITAGTGPAEGGGNSGASIAPIGPGSSSEFEPAVIAASVGTDARPTSNATRTTYRRVGARKPSALYTPFRRLRMTLSGGTSSSSSSGTAGHPLTECGASTAGRSTSGYPVSAIGVNDGCGGWQRQKAPVRAEEATRKALIRTNTATNRSGRFRDCDRPDLWRHSRSLRGWGRRHRRRRARYLRGAVGVVTPRQGLCCSLEWHTATVGPRRTAARQPHPGQARRHSGQPRGRVIPTVA